jgi:predicted alpha/beta-hydrolase family hydrolase
VADPERTELTIELAPAAPSSARPRAASRRPAARGDSEGGEAQPRSVSAILMRPRDARWLYLLAHGAGAGMRHTFLENLAARLSSHGVATLRYQFHYVEVGRGRPDPAPDLEGTVRAAAAEAARRAPDLPLIAGGKSMGGRMTSQAQAGEPLPGVRGIAFVGFPLHPPGKPSTARAEHLARVEVPMLFLHGTRDELADLSLLEPVLDRLGRRGDLHIVDGADHGFHVLVRSGRRDADVLDEIAAEIAGFAARCCQEPEARRPR